MKKSQMNVMTALYGVAGASAFDASNLLHVGLATNEIATERTLIPEGDQRFKIGKPNISSGEGKDGRTWVKVDLKLELDEAAVLAELGVDRLMTSYQLFLDLTEENTLATGPNKNIRLGQLYKAAGLEGDEVSISQLEGRQVIGQVRHRMSDRQVPYDEVIGFAPVE